MTDAIRHRGPDGEGFMTATNGSALPHYHNIQQNRTRSDLPYSPSSPVYSAPAQSFLAFGHRRLAIIDLSEAGHQPMCSVSGDTWITFNGEIYNYIELRQELQQAGRHFISESDTEVILAAYLEWGTDCVKKFNGMWSFCIYDVKKQLCFASRDRFGVKPFYYLNNNDLLAFASEQKAFVSAGLVTASISDATLHNYLINNVTENGPENFFSGISELMPGYNLLYELSSQALSTHCYYRLQDHVSLANDTLDEKTLIEKTAFAFERSVKLRLRSDVEVGTCLSGGIDSSALAATMAVMTDKPVYCFTSVFHNQPFNEEHFANVVAKKIHARHFKTEPTLQGFMAEVDDLVYSQDVPIWDTSTYAQYKVMELAKQHGIKVVLDGQGADEIFAGYYHHFAAKWNSLLKHGHPMAAIKDISASGKTIPNPFLFYAKELLKEKYHFNARSFTQFFKEDFIRSHAVKNPFMHSSEVNGSLLRDIYDTRLKPFLKCEDRCGMWHSVESRTPFSDDPELIELMFSFNANKKIKNGVSKYLLREAVKDKLPQEIYTRYDKKGFETPMQQWMKTLHPQLISEIKAANFEFVDYNKLDRADPGNALHNKLLFKLFVLCRWQKVFSSK